MARPPQMQMPPVKYSQTNLGGGQTAQGVSFSGGLDLVTPSLRLQPGALRDVQNFECAQSGGYARIQGYERYSGQPAPSAASYLQIEVDNFTFGILVGWTVTQANTGATGLIIGITQAQIGAQGTYVGLILALVTGTFNTTDNLSTPESGVFGNAAPVTISISAQAAAQYTAAAADAVRALIGAVPGSGPILGVVAMTFGGVDTVYAFRANAHATAVAIYKSTSSGWVLVPLFNLVLWTQGKAQPIDGDVLTQGGVTATIQRVMWQSGAFAASPGNTAVGAFVVTNPVGGNFTAGAASTTSGGMITLSGAQTPITIAVGGRYEFTKYNFSGQLITRRIYGCDGVNQCFEFDGTTYSPISTGLSPDQPSHLTSHKNFLIVSQGSSISYCGVGTPFKWDSTDGGGEIATGDVVTCMLTLPGSQTTATLGVYLATNVSFLYGTDPTTFNYVTFNTGLGAVPYSAQNLFDTFIMDDLGVVTLRTTLNWGNFLPTALTKNILPLILQERQKLVATSIARAKSQYRVYYSDGWGIWLTMINQQYLGAGVVVFPNPVSCCDEWVTSLGEEVTYFGSSDGQGYVYQMDVGTSFDGAAINAYIKAAWDPIKTPRFLKRFRAASIEVQGGGYALINFGYMLGYGTPLIGQPSSVAYPSNFASAPYWDQFTWDNFTWDGSTLAPTDVDVTGTAENIQPVISSGTNYMQAYTLNSVIWHYSMRRAIRV